MQPQEKSPAEHRDLRNPPYTSQELRQQKLIQTLKGDLYLRVEAK